MSMARQDNFGEGTDRNQQNQSRGNIGQSASEEGRDTSRGGYRSVEREDRNTDRQYGADSRRDQAEQQADRFGSDRYADANRDDYQSFSQGFSMNDESDQPYLGTRRDDDGSADEDYGSWLDRGERHRSLSRGYENLQRRAQGGTSPSPTQQSGAQFY